MDFFWRLLGYNEEAQEDQNDQPKEVEPVPKMESTIPEAPTLPVVPEDKKNRKKRNGVNRVRNFEKFFINYKDDVLSRDELRLIHDNMCRDNYDYSVDKSYQEAKYDEFNKILAEIKIQDPKLRVKIDPLQGQVVDMATIEKHLDKESTKK